MNPWRKRRRQKLRRQGEGCYEPMISLASLGITVTVGPLMAGGPPRSLVFMRQIDSDGTEESDTNFINRALAEASSQNPIVHDPSEFFGMDHDTGVITS